MNYFELVVDIWPALWSGLRLTVELAVASFALGLALGLFLALLRLSPIGPVALVGHLYVDIVRGTPLLVQLFLIYYGLPQFGISPSPFAAATIALGGNYAAYLAEVFRAGLLSVDQGQWEAAEALGFEGQVLMRRVILPQAIRIALPGIGNYANSMIKDTSLASVVTVNELLRQGQIEVAYSFRTFDIYLTVALLYLVVSLPLTYFTKRLERRTARGYA
jgi:polar amino acid transport system permease protein